MNSSRVINVPKGSITFKDTTKVALCAACGKYGADYVIYHGGTIPNGPHAQPSIVGVALCFFQPPTFQRGSAFSTIPAIGGPDPVPTGCSAEYRDWQEEELRKGDISSPKPDFLVALLHRWLLEKKGRRIHLTP